MRMNKRNAALKVCRLALFGLVGLLLILPPACRRQKESKEELPKRDINAVMADHTGELMAIPGVTGVAIGELEDHTPCILVLVEEETDKIRKDIPKALEGHPVRLLVSGKIVPMGND